MNYLKTRFNRWMVYNRTIKELESMTPRELYDIGITPGDIHAVAAEASINCFP